MEERKRKNITIDAVENEDSQDKVDVQSTNKFDPKNYLNVRLDEGQLSKEIRIRILPIDKDSDTPFKRIKMHNLRVPKDIAPSGFKSYICLEKTDDIDHEKFGHKCPFCELNREAYKKSTEATSPVDKDRYKKISLENMATDVGIIRCIERGHEEDGPKFWKFNIRQDKMDPLNKIKKLFAIRLQESREIIEEAKANGEDISNLHELNILDLYEGKDLKLTITAVLDKTTGKPNGKTSIDITDYGAVKPLTTDEELMAKWVDDEKVWNDVFTAKSYEYLVILMNGDKPWFDRTTGRWVAQSANNSVKEDEISKADKEIKDAETTILSVPETKADGEEELPY